MDLEGKSYAQKFAAEGPLWGLKGRELIRKTGFLADMQAKMVYETDLIKIFSWMEETFRKELSSIDARPLAG